MAGWGYEQLHTPLIRAPSTRIALAGEHRDIALERLRTTSSASSSLPRNASSDYMNDSKNAFVYRYGRRFLRDPTLRYPLPVDLAELHRQTLRTLMLMRIHGAPFCSPFFEDSAPKKVLEVACGSALWSSACHDYFKAHGFPNVSFTGVDIAPLAPDLKAQGLNWRFVQHDCRDTPWPFPDEEFDFLFIKDVGLAYGLSDALADTMRLLKPGGVVEIWESDYLFRTLLPHPTIPPGTTEEQVEQADDTATYIMSPSTAFVDSQNTYLSDYNEWVQKAFDKRHLIALPCSTTSWAFSYSDLIGEMGSRRVAIPFGEVRWEREGVGVGSVQTKGHLRGKSAAIAEKQSNIEAKTLTANQAALRRTALTTTIQLIEALEPLLKVESGKRQDEWDRWWAGMTHDLLEHNGTINGECLELGAWWGRKT